MARIVEECECVVILLLRADLSVKIIENTLEFSEVDIFVVADLNAITVLFFQSIENFHDVYVILVSAI